MGVAGRGGGDPLLPPDKRPSTKGIRQSWGLRLLPMAMEGRRESGVGGKMAYPSLCCLSAWLTLLTETSDLGLITVSSPAPHNLQPFMQSASWHLWPPRPSDPHHFPEYPRGRAPLSCQSRK